MYARSLRERLVGAGEGGALTARLRMNPTPQSFACSL